MPDRDKPPEMRLSPAGVSALAHDGPGIAGALLVSGGAGLAWLPAGLIIAGLFLLAYSVLAARARIVAAQIELQKVSAKS